MPALSRRSVEVVLGIALAVVLLSSVAVIWFTFRGSFSNKITVSAQLAQAGDALEQGDVVTYKDIIIGEVQSAAGKVNGGAVAKLSIDPAAAAVIPARVTAVAVPQNLFGITRIELIPPAQVTPGEPMLAAGDVIRADTNPAAESLQTALSNAYALLTSVHPAELDAALSSLATALDGKGAVLGQLLTEADSTLRALAPQLPALDDTVRSLATVTQEVADNAPQLLSTLQNTLVVSSAILADKQAVASLLGAAPGAVGDTLAVLTPQTVNNAVTVISDEQPVIDALAANPSALSRTIDGFKQFANTFADITSSGPYVNVSLVLTGANFAQVANAINGGPGHVFDSISDPPLYTAANCPRYDGEVGPNCTATAAAHVLSTGTSYGGNSSSVGSPAEIAAVQAAAAAITHQSAAALPGTIVDLLLGPLLRGTPAVIR